MTEGWAQENRSIQRLRLIVQGHVQGVGFRPFVYRLATELGLGGYVQNCSTGVIIEVEGQNSELEQFCQRLESDKPPHVRYYTMEASWLAPCGHRAFRILPSSKNDQTRAWILPDLASCPDCLKEVFDPKNRRYLYPFTNCTHCGPRYSIVLSIPYDRSNTTMRGFNMCAACRKEYEDPLDRRFHAQPNACWSCGPRPVLWDRSGNEIARDVDALEQAAHAIDEGAIVAVKGLGGFHLMVRCDEAELVLHLRKRKRRDWKPFAVMVPTISVADQICELNEAERRILQSSASPIVLARKRSVALDERYKVCEEVAPGLNRLGIMLPYTPLHHILLRWLNRPVVATSGNLSDEPICTDEQEALQRLGGIADLFLVHNRPIARHVDDSVVVVVHGKEIVWRRARGYVPSPILLPLESEPACAVGGHLKNSVALAKGKLAIISQHIGDLDTQSARLLHNAVIDDLARLFEIKPLKLACDLHPDYASTVMAQARGAFLFRVQHHVAHVLSAMAENELEPPCLGIAWDGTGYGPDGTVWGGEFFLVTKSGFYRVATLKPFPLPGGEKAVREPWRSALGLLWSLYASQLGAHPIWSNWVKAVGLTETKLGILVRALDRRINSPLCTSIGRLFDAVAALLNLSYVAHYEAEAAMMLEALAEGIKDENGIENRYDVSLVAMCDDASLRPDVPEDLYPLQQVRPFWTIDWRPIVQGIEHDIKRGLPAGLIARRFHNSLVGLVLTVAEEVMKRLEPNLKTIVLSGGCFQNVLLVSGCEEILKQRGFQVARHQRTPPGDGGIALGQLYALAMAQWVKNRNIGLD